MAQSWKFRKFTELAASALNAFFIAVTFWLLFVALFKKEWIVLFLSSMERLVGTLGYWNYPLAFLFSIVESFPVIGVLIPGQQVMLIVGGFFGRDHLPQTIAVCAIGAVIGNFVGYWLGRRYGKIFFSRYGDAFGLGRTELRYLEKQVAKNGPLFVIIGKFHNMTRAFVPFIAGSAGMHAKGFWIYNVIGSVLWAATIISLSVLFANHYRIILDYIGYVFLAIIATFISYVALFRRKEFARYMEEKRLEIEEKIEESKR